MTEWYYWSAIMLAAVIVGVSKSGLAISLGTINVPLLALVMPARDAAGVLLPVMLVVDAVALFIYARKVDRRILSIMLPGCLAGTGLGWLLSVSVSEAAVRLAIGIITFIFVVDAWFPIRRKLEGLPPSPRWGAFWGAVTGFTSFISHTGGPPFQIFVLPRRLTPAVFAGTATVFFAINNAAKLVPYYLLGQLEATNLYLSTLMIPVALIAMALGVVLVRVVSPRIFYHLAYLLLLVFSIQLVWDGIAGMTG